MMPTIDLGLRKTFILPGMGADSNMYPPTHYRHLSWVVFVDWPAYHGETTIEALAKRVVDEYRITADAIVGGASLGGMVAVQIARMLKIRRVILIGSTAQPRDINPALMRLSGLAHLAHVPHLQWIAGKLNPSGSNLFLSMFERSDGEFMKAMARAIPRWTGIDGYRCEIRRIHGARDRVIFPPANRATIVPDAGHLLPMTHGEIVARFLARHTFRCRRGVRKEPRIVPCL